MAVTVARHNKTFREYYLKKREEGFSYKKAIMSVVPVSVKSAAVPGNSATLS
jgi:hypothetical protein